MSKSIKETSNQNEHEAFEIIEMAIDDLEVLTRAFNVISEVCEELNNPRLNFDSQPSKTCIN
jgi:hypothetical protein